MVRKLKNKWVFILLGIFLGEFGIHNFYTGYIGRGVVKLMITVVFLIGEYFIGVVMFVAGYALTLYSAWLAIVSALSYVWDFERNWKMAGIVFIGSVVFDLVTSIWAAIMAKGVRERSRYAISILKQKCAVVCGSV